MVMSKNIAADHVRVKRVYDRPIAADGIRVLIDRLWPRGVSKKHAAIEIWAKDVAPSAALREWFGHEPARWREFRRRYTAELRRNPATLKALRDLARQKRITLVFSAHDELHNNAVALRATLLGRAPPKQSAHDRRLRADEAGE
jgi:uncharacterized protein YeaO (DUF488 family)